MERVHARAGRAAPSAYLLKGRGGQPRWANRESTRPAAREPAPTSTPRSRGGSPGEISAPRSGLKRAGPSASGAVLVLVAHGRFQPGESPTSW